MKKEILKMLKEQRSIKINDLFALFNGVTKDKYMEIAKCISSIVENEDVYVKDYTLFYNDDNKLLIGRIVVNYGGRKCFLIYNGKKIFIDRKYLNYYLNNDLVQFKMLDNVSIKGLYKREKDNIACIYKVDRKEKAIFIADDPNIVLEVEVDNINKFKLSTNDKVLIKINKVHKKIEGSIIEIIGNAYDKGVDITSVLLENKVDLEFKNDVLDELDKIDNTIDVEQLKGRKDLCDDITITIDGDDSKDFDDAISLHKYDEYFKLKVHIADVSYYVKEDSAIDKEALKRGTSIYVCDRVVPMLPEKLSNDLCSLKPNIKRLALTCEIDIDYSGEIIDYMFYESIIKSNYRMTYNDVNKILDNDADVCKQYQDIKSVIYDMLLLSKIIRRKRFDNGAIDFEKDEAKIILNDNGEVLDIVLRERRNSEKIIEDFMILANECVARHMKWLELPCIYRVHEDPKRIQLDAYIKTVKNLGYIIKGKSHTSLALQKSLDYFKDKTEYPVLKELLLKSMKKAVYSHQCSGHFALGLKEYCHFTSPIRRYPDLVVHRMMKKYVLTNNLSDNESDEARLINVAIKNSESERKAIKVERQIEDMKKAEYMSRYIGHSFEGIITSIMYFGFFIELSNTIEGLVNTYLLPVDFTCNGNSMYSEDLNLTFTLGQKVKVKCIRTDKLSGKIEFESKDIHLSLIKELNTYAI